MNSSGNEERKKVRASKTDYVLDNKLELKRENSIKTTTTHEKVIKILTTIKAYLKELNTKLDLINDLNWVIKKINSHSLYTYEFSNDDCFGSEKYDQNEMKNLLKFLNDVKEEPEFKGRSTKKLQPYLSSMSGGDRSLSMISPHSRHESTNNVRQHELEENLIEIKELKESFDLNDDQELEKLEEWDFNIFEFEERFGRCEVYSLVARYSLRKFSLDVFFDDFKLTNFLNQTQSLYNEVPYHNSLHASDVTQTMLLILTKGNIIELIHLIDLDLISLIVSCLVHDLGHPSTNNNFQVNSFSSFAVVYNDKNVLENFHCSETFKILKKDESNIFSDFDFSQFRHMRKRVIELILATDMVNHARTYSLVKNRVTNYLISKEITEFVDAESKNLFDEQQEILNFLIHSCDLGHCTKNTDVSVKWTLLIMEEFWKQGDLEKNLGLPVSFLCDRVSADIPKSQMVFIRGLILPNFEILGEIDYGYQKFVENLKKNLEHWTKLADEKNKENETNTSKDRQDILKV